MSENLDPRMTVEAWAEILVKNWRAKMKQLDVNDSYVLDNSFLFSVIGNAGEIPERIEFAFAYYGKFADMGVGKGVTTKDAGSKGKRKVKPWYSRTFYAETRKLIELLAEKYAYRGQAYIVEAFNKKSDE